MYQKGTGFLAASILLNQAKGDQHAVLHLFCQGVEVMMKGVLLIVDYDAFQPQLKRLGHNLLATTDAAMQAAGLPVFKGSARKELVLLNTLYSKHLLRYGSGYDILVDPQTIDHKRALQRIGALIRRFQRRGIPNAVAV